MERKAVQEIALEEMRELFLRIPTGRQQAQVLSFSPLYGGNNTITGRVVSTVPNFDTVPKSEIPKSNIDYLAVELRIINRLKEQGSEAPAPSNNRKDAKNQVWRWLYIDTNSPETP